MKLFSPSLFAVSLAAFSVAALLPAETLAATPKAYTLSTTFHVGGEGRGWDYVTVDPEHHLLFASRDSHVMVIDSITGGGVANIAGLKRCHGVALVPGVGRGFISDGDGSIVIFDLKTYSVLGKIKTLPDVDGISYDPLSNKVWVVSGDGGSILSISPDVDPITGTTEKPVSLGGKPEFFVVMEGKAYINLVDRDIVAVVDTRSRKVIGRWSTSPGSGPVSMAMDRKNHRLFIGCRKTAKLIVMNSDNGKVLSEVPIGAGVDATQFDGDVFCSSRDGTLTIARETAPGHFERIQTLATRRWSGTMGIDPSTHTLYVPGAEFEDEPESVTSRPTAIVPDSFAILVINPTGVSPPYGKAADNKIYAQQLAIETVAANPDLGGIGFHAVAPGSRDYTIIAQLRDLIGKRSSPADMEVIKRDQTLIYPGPIEGSPRIASLNPLRDSSGRIIGMVVFSFKQGPGVDKLSVHVRSVALVNQLAEKIPDAAALFNPTAISASSH
ncbi:MAG: hypothetical protein JWM32_1046 [Verrucomicrobia bacterium]|nr:hypothetical protein [Verrucomicrobiota bacterium]